MAPRLFLLVGFVLLSAPTLPAADSDEPSAGGKKASEWLRLLEDQKTAANRRRGAVLALGIIGPKTPEIVAALTKSLQSDPEAEVRRQAASVLGQFGPQENPPTRE